MAGMVAGSAAVVAMVVASATPAFANTSAYELYCPGTPVGNIALNNVVTNGTISPATPSAGSQFNLTNYQSTVSIPSQIVSAAQALGNSAITGSASEQIDATGATPAKLSAGTLTINSPIPSPVPSTGLSLTLPSTPSTVGPFTASSGTITLTVDPAVSLTLVVSGSNLNITCHPYPNNTVASGIVTATPPGAEASPVIATTSAGTTSPTTAATTATTAATTQTTTAPTTAATTATTAASSTAAASSAPLASTGPGPDLWIVALVGFIALYLGSVALALVERPRSVLRRLLRLQPRMATVAAGPAVSAAPTPSAPVATTAPGGPANRAQAPPTYRRSGSHGLWFEGCEPDGGSSG